MTDPQTVYDSWLTRDSRIRYAVPRFVEGTVRNPTSRLLAQAGHKLHDLALGDYYICRACDRKGELRVWRAREGGSQAQPWIIEDLPSDCPCGAERNFRYADDVEVA